MAHPRRPRCGLPAGGVLFRWDDLVFTHIGARVPGRDGEFLINPYGLLTLGPTIADAFLGMYLFETVCTIQVRALAGSRELVHVDSRIIAGAQAQARQVTRGVGGGALNWPGLLRRLDRENPGYAD